MARRAWCDGRGRRTCRAARHSRGGRPACSPGTQADFEGAVRPRRTGRAGPQDRPARRRRRSGSRARCLRSRRSPRSVRSDRRQTFVAHPASFFFPQSRRCGKGRPSAIMLPSPISSSARAPCGPSRPSSLSAMPTISQFGWAINEAARMARDAIADRPVCGLSRQAAARRSRVERLMPA